MQRVIPPSGTPGGGKGGGGRGGDGGDGGGDGGDGGGFGGDGGGNGGDGGDGGGLGGGGEMRCPQSLQSVPRAQAEYSEPGPPSSHSPLLPNA